MAKYWLSALMLWLWTGLSSAVVPPSPAVDSGEHRTLRFVVYYPHFPPYIFTNPLGDVSGIVPDLLSPFFTEQKIRVDYLIDNRAGAEQRLYRGDVDAMMLSPEWAAHPERLLFSDSIVAYDDYFFARTLAEADISANQLKGKKICTREYYVYPMLEPLFSKGVLIRMDSSSQEAQLRMMLNQRCDLAYLNDLVAGWLMQQNFTQSTIYSSPLYVGRSGLTIALHQRWQPILPALNQFLQQQRQHGVVQKVIARYVPESYGYSK